MNNYKFALYYEVQDSGNAYVKTKEVLNPSGKYLCYKPFLFDSVEDAMKFRENPPMDLINDDLWYGKEHWGILVIEEKELESYKSKN